MLRFVYGCAVAVTLAACLPGCSEQCKECEECEECKECPECAADETVCGDICCVPGTTCVSAGKCAYPYTTAQLMVYLCPSFNDGTEGCEVNYFTLGGDCLPVQDYTPDSCYNTGFPVKGGESYAMAACRDCNGNCSNPVVIETPAGFTSPIFDSKTYWYCDTPCGQDKDCSQGP